MTVIVSCTGMPWETLLHHVEAMEDLHAAIGAAEAAKVVHPEPAQRRDLGTGAVLAMLLG